MTEFTVKLRHYCRNPKCKTKLPQPVANDREAFCCRGCRESFYLHRCRICECAIEQKGGQQRYVCKKAKCRNAFRAYGGMARYLLPPSASMRPETPISRGLKSVTRPVEDTNSWRIVAGPPLTPSQFHCATIPDGPDGSWKSGEYQRIEAKNRAALKAAEQSEIEANGYFTEPDWREVVSKDGVTCFVTRFRDQKPKPQRAVPHVPDDLNVIPNFLRRDPPQDDFKIAA